MTKSKNKKVLIVDDEEDIIEMVRFRLEKSGYEVMSALDGPSGIDTAVAAKPDIILLDVSMPNMDGWEVCRRLRANPVTCHCKIIIITATRKLEEARTCGPDQLLLKPFNFQELIDALNKVSEENEISMSG